MEYPRYLVRFANGAWLKQIVYAAAKIKGYTTTHEWREAKHFAAAELPEMARLVRHIKKPHFAGIYAIDIAEPEFIDPAAIKGGNLL